MGLLELPNTSKGVLIALGAVAVVVIWLYATTLLTVGLGTVVVAIVVYGVYVLGVRLHRFFTNASLR